MIAHDDVRQFVEAITRVVIGGFQHLLNDGLAGFKINDLQEVFSERCKESIALR